MARDFNQTEWSYDGDNRIWNNTKTLQTIRLEKAESNSTQILKEKLVHLHLMTATPTLT